MDTTQKNREDASRRQRQETPQGAQKRPQEAKKPRPAAAGEPARRRPAQQAPAKAGEKAAAGTAQRPKQQRPAGERPARPPQAGEKRERPVAAPAKRQNPAPARKKPEAKPTNRPQTSGKRPAKSQEPTDLSSKKRAYGNSKPKKKSLLTRMVETIASTAQKTAARSKARKEGKGKTSRPVQPAPAVIYTQPKAFNRTRLLMQMLIVAAIVAALVMGLSVFFKVENITVSGAKVYSAWSVREASGIEEGDNLLTFSHARAGALIKANLPYVKTVRFGIKLPDTVNIIIEEEDVVYAIKDNTGTWWLMNSKGRVVEMSNGSKAANYTQILGVTLDNPTPNTQAVATESLPTETDASGEPIPLTVTGQQRLEAAKEILVALENNDIVGDAASVDVSRTEDIILWYGSRYQVNLGDSTRLDYKIACMNDCILQLSDFQSGILDISFTIWPDKVVYTPFA